MAVAPIRPDEVLTKRRDSFPAFVIEAFNERRLMRMILNGLYRRDVQ